MVHYGVSPSNALGVTESSRRVLPERHFLFSPFFGARIALGKSSGRPPQFRRRTMNKHLEDIIKTIEEAQRQIADTRRAREDSNSDLHDFEDAEQGLAWVKKKLEKLLTKKHA
jgi:hypothetical protein